MTNTWPAYTVGSQMNTWPEMPLLGFDLETTGTDPYSDLMVDMALVLDDPVNAVVQKWEWLINPGVEIPLNATAIHGISTDHAIENGVDTKKAIAQIMLAIASVREVYGELPPVCIYNAAFDAPIILRQSFGAVGLDWIILDPMVMDKALDKYRPGKRTLTAVSAAYGLAVKNAHRAAGDCLSAMRLMRAIGNRFPQVGETNPLQLYQMQIPAYRGQMEQFREYRRRNGEAEFDCNLSWPFDSNRIFGDQIGPAYCEDLYARN